MIHHFTAQQLTAARCRQRCGVSKAPYILGLEVSQYIKTGLTMSKSSNSPVPSESSAATHPSVNQHGEVQATSDAVQTQVADDVTIQVSDAVHTNVADDVPIPATDAVQMCANCKCRPVAREVKCGFCDWCERCDLSLFSTWQYSTKGNAMNGGSLIHQRIPLCTMTEYAHADTSPYATDHWRVLAKRICCRCIYLSLYLSQPMLTFVCA